MHAVRRTAISCLRRRLPPPHTRHLNYLISMPKLSPTMTGARILKWHLTAPGDFVDCYDLILEIEADNLVDEGSRSVLEIEAGRSVHKMLLESCETGGIVRVLAPADVEGGGPTLPPGTPLAILCEDEEDAAEFSEESGWQCPAWDAAAAGGAGGAEGGAEGVVGGSAQIDYSGLGQMNVADDGGVGAEWLKAAGLQPWTWQAYTGSTDSDGGGEGPPPSLPVDPLAPIMMMPDDGKG